MSILFLLSVVSSIQLRSHFFSCLSNSGKAAESHKILSIYSLSPVRRTLIVMGSSISQVKQVEWRTSENPSRCDEQCVPERSSLRCNAIGCRTAISHNNLWSTIVPYRQMVED